MSVKKVEFPIKLDVQRLTALWGFSEAALGAILHILKVPLTGLLIGGAAVFFIALIARYSESPSQILKSTLVVILIKAFVTPFIPLNSYFAVSLQGFLGYLFFKFIPSFNLAAILLGMITLTISAFQKLFIITFLFGNTFWNSIDVFATYIITQHSFLKSIHSIKASEVIILVYASIHFLGGAFVGYKATQVDKWLKKKKNTFNFSELNMISSVSIFEQNKSGKRKRWWQRKSGIVLIVFSIFMMILSYSIPQIGKSTAINILIMIFRSILISLIWFYFISPIIIKQFQKFIEKRKFDHASEINKLTSTFPQFRKVINYCWKESSKFDGLKRVTQFLSNSLALLLIVDLSNEKD